MANYISREAALIAQNKSMNLNEMRERLKRLHAADVVEVRHGRWVGETVPDFDLCGVKYFHCSKCGWAEQVDYYNYCPNCGARMDGGADSGGA